MEIAEIEFYTKQSGRNEVLDYVEGLQVKEKKRALNDFEKMTEPGMANNMLRSEHIKDFKGNVYKNIYELRSWDNRFLFCLKEKIAYFTNAFRKKSNNTPPGELEKAKAIRDLIMKN